MTFKYVPLFLVVIIGTFLIHEAGHFLVGKLLGYEMFVSINKAGIAKGNSATAAWHPYAITIGGPAVTIIQAAIGCWIAHRHKAIWAFPVVFMALMMRVMAAGISLSSPNDEYRVSEWLGIGPWTLPLVTVLGLLILTGLTGRVLKLGWKSWVVAFLLCSAGITAIVFTEPYWPGLVW